MIADLEALGPLGEEMARRARSAGVLLIWRVQSRFVRSTLVRKGKTEGTTVTSSTGHGVQIVTDDGRTALASRDDLRSDAALKLLDRAVDVAARAEALRITPGTLPPLRPLQDRAVPDGLEAFASIDLAKVGRRLVELESGLAADVPGVQLRLHFRAELDAWRIFRDDGTDVLFAMPRCTLGMRATSAGDGARHGVSAASSARAPTCPGTVRRWSASFDARDRRRGWRPSLPDAPLHPAGSFPLRHRLRAGQGSGARGIRPRRGGRRLSLLGPRPGGALPRRRRGRRCDTSRSSTSRSTATTPGSPSAPTASAASAPPS